MAGLVGAFASRPLTSAERAGVRAMAQRLDFTGTSVLDWWEDDRLAVCRVHHPFDPPAPALAHRELEVVALLDGEVHDAEPSRDPAPAASGAASSRADETLRCLDLYARHGVDGLSRLDGSFTLLLHERRAGRLLLAGDRFASRPIFYHAGRERLTFATQSRCVLLPDVPRRLDAAGVRQFVVFQTILDERTTLEGVRALPPASVLAFPAAVPAPRRYWTLVHAPEEIVPEERLAEGLAAALAASIRRCARDSDRTALLLSGGLDSRLVVGAAERPLTAVTLADSDNRQVALARTVAARRGFPFVFLQRDPDFYVNLVDQGVALGDGAYRYDHAHFAHLRGAIPPHLTTALTGFWCDFLLKGSALPNRRLRFAGWAATRSVPIPVPAGITTDALTDLVLSTLNYCQWSHPALLGIFGAERRAAVTDEIRALVSGLLDRAAHHASGPEYRYMDVRLNMMATRSPAFLNVLGLRHHFRDRTFTFDNTVLDRALRIPARLRVGGRIMRRVLRLLAPDLYGIPDANIGVRPGTPPLLEHLHHRLWVYGRRLRPGPAPSDPAMTAGGWPDMAELIRHRPALRQRLAEVLADPTALPPEVFDLRATAALLADHLERRRDATALLLNLLTFGVWHRQVMV